MVLVGRAHSQTVLGLFRPVLPQDTEGSGREFYGATRASGLWAKEHDALAGDALSRPEELNT